MTPTRKKRLVFIRSQKAKPLPTTEKQTKPATNRQPITTSDGLMNEVAAAAYLGLSVSTLQNRRSLRLPPVFRKTGRRIFYERKSLEDYRDG